VHPGALANSPPRFFHSDHLVPSKYLWYIVLSIPLIKVSVRFGPQEHAAGALVNIPPRLAGLVYPVVFKDPCHIASSTPL